MNKTVSAPKGWRSFPAHGWLGLALIAVFWTLNWSLSSRMPVTSWGFFPLWLGYVLCVDAINLARRGTSLLARSRRGFVSLFLVSAPVWWLFEVLNWRLQNWHYVGRELFSDLEYLLLASFSFSTVIPAVFGTAELIASFGWLQRLPEGPKLRPDRPTTLLFFTAGAFMLTALLVWPEIFFPLIWISLYCLLAPVSIWMGNRSLAERTRFGDWRPAVALALGAVTCGFFWELWNFFSFPKWVYTVPYADFAHIFEMPLLGYGGYLPFGLELFVLYHLAAGIFRKGKTDYVIRGLFPNHSDA